MAKKINQVFICQKCSYQATKWMGKCPECLEWNSFTEEASSPQQRSGPAASLKDFNLPQALSEISTEDHFKVETGIGEFDRVVGGGLVNGSVILIGGEPGIGKSTLLMEVSGKLAALGAKSKEKILYVSGEESVGQLANRSRRLGIEDNNFFLYHETNWQNIQEQLKKLRPAYFILDSIQTTYSAEIMSAPGTVSQIREITHEIVNFAKANNITCFIIGHITKEGAIAGPKILEHMVDLVIYFEGDQFGHYRLLRVIKNRFGNINEVGIFEMREKGLVEVGNPSQYFLDSTLTNSFGRSLTSIVEGSRNLFVEVQALVVDNKYGNGRRTTHGIDNNRLSMLVAVIEKYFGIFLSLNDIYVNVVGGIKLVSRESDLCIIASILSSLRSKPIDSSTIFLGEVGLTGEVRSVPQIEIRLKEIAQLSYKRVVTSTRTANEYKGKFALEIVGISRADQIEELLF